MTANAKGRPAGTGATPKTTSNTADSAAIVAENQPKKPEIDLASWAALGKSSRTERRPKRKWGRK